MSRLGHFPQSTGYLSASVLKYIALVAMLLDHISKVVGQKWVITQLGAMADQGSVSWELYDRCYDIAVNLLPAIGRMAFPLFCFLIVEGFLHTRNQKIYLLRVLFFAVLAEVPFDMAFFSWSSHYPVYIYYQNVLFTLALGLGMLMAVQWLGRWSEIKDKKLQTVLFQCVVAVAVGLIADMTMVDYGSTGIYYIFFLYLLRGNRLWQALAVVAIFMASSGAGLFFVVLAGLAILLYNGERGTKHPKYLFYGFYPAHLLILAMVAMVIL